MLSRQILCRNWIGTIRSESGDTHPNWFIGLLEKGIRLYGSEELMT